MKLIGAYIVGILTFLIAVVAGVLIVMQSGNDWEFSVFSWDWQTSGALALLAAVIFGVAVPFLLKALLRCVMLIAKNKSATNKVNKAAAKAAAPVPTPTPSSTDA